jgi:hypothetical protein
MWLKIINGLLGITWAVAILIREIMGKPFDPVMGFFGLFNMIIYVSISTEEK